MPGGPSPAPGGTNRPFEVDGRRNEIRILRDGHPGSTLWIYWTYNHFDPEHYEEREELPGQLTRRDDAVPRRMTDVEVGHYCYRLVKEAFEARAVVVPQAVSFLSPAVFAGSCCQRRAG